MVPRASALIALVAGALAFAPAAAAQVQDRPARQGGTGVFGGGQAVPPPPSAAQTQQTLALTISALGTYDDRSRAEQRPGLEPRLEPLNRQSAGLLNAGLRYRVGNLRRWFTAQGAGFFTAQEVERAAGGELRAQAMTTFGRRNRLDVSHAYRDAPFMTLAGFGDLAVTVGPGVLPDSDPTLGLHRQRSRVSTTAASITREWTTRQGTSFGYSYARTDYPGAALGFDTRAQSVNVQHTWQFRRSVGLVASYDRSRSSYVDHDGQQPLSQSAGLGIDYVRRLSPTRQIAFGGDVGASYVDVISPAGEQGSGRWSPSGAGRVRVDIGRSWAVTADYSRSPTVLHQAVLQTFYSDAFAVNTGGLITSRLDATVTGSLARGRTPGGAGELGRYESLTAVAQLRWAISRSVATIMAYTFHDYRIRNVTVARGFPVQARLNGVRVGVSVWAPLFGDRRAAAPAR